MGMSTDTYTDRIRQFCTAFKLPTVGAEAVPRFQQAGHGEALETLLEVLELEAEDRQQRRTTGCGAPPACHRVRPGTPSSATGFQPDYNSNWVSWPKATSWSRG